MDKPSIVEVIDKWVSLRKVGKEYLGLCPFHADQTPSLSINEDKGVFYCFGCGESGDVFDFIMKLDGFSFFEACRSLGVEPDRIPERAPLDPIREQAEIITAWANGQFDRAQSMLRLISSRVYVAHELKWREEMERLAREWQILSVLAEDLQTPKHAIALWQNRESIERILQDADFEPLPTFPELTPEYRDKLKAYVRGEA